MKKYNLEYYFLMYFKKLVIILIITTILIECATPLYLPTEIDAKNCNTSVEKLKMGRELYLKKCGGCHSLYLPSQYTKHEWQKIMNEMQKPAKINNYQKELIIKYLIIKSKNN